MFTLKKLWRNPKQTNLHIYNAQEITRETEEEQEAHGEQEAHEVRGEKMFDTLPPPYSETPLNDGTKSSAYRRQSTSYPVLTKYAFAVEDSEFLCDSLFFWCLTEIMAVTFPTNFVRLKAIIAKINPRWAGASHLRESGSLLHSSVRPIIVELTILVRNLEESLAGNRWLFVHKKDKELVRRWVLLPVRARQMNLDYVLEVLGRYDCVAKKTLVDYWMPLSPSTQLRDAPAMLDLGDTLASHTLLLRSLELDKKLEFVFEESINAFWKAKRLKGLRTSEELQEEFLSSGKKCCWWPVSDRYMNLAKALREPGPSSVMDDPFGPSRSRLREKRILFRA